MHTLDRDVDGFEFASDVASHEVNCVGGADVPLEMHSIRGGKVDDLDVTEGHVEDLLTLVNPVDYLCFDVTLLW